MAKRQPYYLIDIRNKDFGYTSGWIDRDAAMLLACFQVLKEFVEREDPFKYHFRKDGKPPKRSECTSKEEYEALKAHRVTGKEIWDLYVWWTKTRKREHATHLKLLNSMQHRPVVAGSVEWRNVFKQSHLLDQKDQDMLIRLVKVREYLWT